MKDRIVYLKHMCNSSQTNPKNRAVAAALLVDC